MNDAITKLINELIAASKDAENARETLRVAENELSEARRALWAAIVEKDDEIIRLRHQLPLPQGPGDGYKMPL
jgi:prefoldin subunit 5